VDAESFSCNPVVRRRSVSTRSIDPEDMRQTEAEGHLRGTLKASTNRNNVIDRKRSAICLLQELGIVSVLSEVSTNSVDVNAVFQHVRLHLPKAFEGGARPGFRGHFTSSEEA
jgi:hypothetical protein